MSLAAVFAFSFLVSAGALPVAVADCCLLSEAVLLTSPLAAARLLPDSEAVLSSPGRGLAFAPPASSALLAWSSSVSLAGSHWIEDIYNSAPTISGFQSRYSAIDIYL